ncbi:hypothetical protein G6L37_05405 [Agrobacterium rubi]|nr:hypothetical protein [Agrobacterium rubi]NTF24794.1 hypothetical protein [Agrobacterium rubi]
MRYRNLEAEKIRSLARATDGLPDRNAMFGDMIRLISLGAATQFSVRPRLTRKMLDQLFATCDKVVRGAFKPLHHVKERKLVTTSRQASYSMLLQVPPTTGFDDMYQLVSLRLFGTTKAFRVYVTSHPVAFQHHAAERLMERTMGVEDALDTLGKDLSKWMPFTGMAEVHFSGSSDFCVPVGNRAGMMMGEFTPLLRSFTHRYKFDQHGCAESSLQTEGRVFVARTFVSATQLRPEQTFSMNLLADWYSAHEQDLRRTENDLLWTWSFGSEDSTSVDALAPDCLASLDRIMENPQFARGVGAEPASAPFVLPDILRLAAA